MRNFNQNTVKCLYNQFIQNMYSKRYEYNQKELKYIT